jgi:hypothetical protein
MQRMINIKQKTKGSRNTAIKKDHYRALRNKIFDILFVDNGQNQTVEVIESRIIDFDAIIEQLEGGNSVFIAPKTPKNVTKTTRALKKQASYISHI